MKHNIVAPSVGESITEVSILKWTKQNGEGVKIGEKLLEIESDKATVEIVAEFAGALSILKPAGERINIGAVIGAIDDAVAGTKSTAAPAATKPATPSAAAPAAAAPKAAAPTTAMHSVGAVTPGMGPAARKAVAEGRSTGIPQAAPAQAAAPAKAVLPPYEMRPGDRRVAMTMLRQKIAERLVMAQHTAAILTTFNEVDMGPVMELRNKQKDAFKTKHGVGLSFMSFFTRACVESLKVLPDVNASIDGKDVIFHDYFDIGIAVGTERGLVVPVVRDAGKMGFVDIEKKIGELAVKARDSKLSIADMSGGTFTISNGGTYGSLLSTPILNPPQSAILGMHKIQERPMAINGKVEIRNMMYLALSYDHRIIDGKGAVTFLVTLKDFLEHPEKLKFEM